MRWSPRFLKRRLYAMLLRLWPAPLGIDGREQARAVLGMIVGLGVTAWCSHWLLSGAGGNSASPWMVASFGASCLLVFSMPSSPLAQPWAVIAGSVFCASVGLLGAASGLPLLALIPLGVALALWGMMRLRCVHPPGAALTLSLLLQPAAHASTLLLAVLCNALLVTLVGTLYNRATGRSYPHAQLGLGKTHRTRRAQPQNQDVDAALSRYNELMAISRNDLLELLQETRHSALQRYWGQLSCADIMTRTVHSIAADTPMEQVGQLLQQSQGRSLPVVDAQQRLLGMIGLEQWLQWAASSPSGGTDKPHDTATRTPSGSSQQRPHWRKPIHALWKLAQRAPARGMPIATARSTMQGALALARPEQPMMELLPLLSRGGLYLIPVIDAHQQLVGIISQTDLLRALYQATGTEQPD